MKNLKNLRLVVKTLRGFEKVAASRIKEVLPTAEVVPSPKSFLGLVLVYCEEEADDARRRVEESVAEAEKVLPIYAVAPSEVKALTEAASKVVSSRIRRGETFAVRTTRRGKHPFTSIDVNIAIGDAVRKLTNASVDLQNPDKIVWVEIVGDLAAISVTEGSVEHRKMGSEKKDLRSFFSKMSIVQMPYLGPLDAAKQFGVRIGRCVQTFEVGEIVIAPIGSVDAKQLSAFTSGVFEGIDARLEIQKRAYGRAVRRVPVYVQNLYELVRDREGEPIVVFEPEGEPLHKVGDQLFSIFADPSSKRVSMLFGSREGIPSGIFRFATLVVDLCPGITISTDFAASSGIMALATVIEERLFS